MSVKGVHGEHDDPASAHHHPLCVRYISGDDLPCICELLDEHAIQVRAEVIADLRAQVEALPSEYDAAEELHYVVRDDVLALLPGEQP